MLMLIVLPTLVSLFCHFAVFTITQAVSKHTNWNVTAFANLVLRGVLFLNALVSIPQRP